VKQHFVPQCYLKAWCDPNTPGGQEPYIWMFSKDGKIKKNKAPKKTFTETDMYTVRMPNGTKDFRLERGLHDLEDLFLQIRDRKLKDSKGLTPIERILLLTFISAMHNRTKAQRDHHKAQWKEVQDMMNKMKKFYENATPEERQAAIQMVPPSDNGSTLTYEEVQKFAEEPMQQVLYPGIYTEVPLLYPLDMAVFNTENIPGFITSDRPCVWFDPLAYKRPPLLRAPGLMYPSIEITLPVSPNQIILLNRSGVGGYIRADDTMVDEFNRRIRFYADEYFVVNHDIVKDIWFYEGVEPDDSWHRIHKKNEDQSNEA